MIGLGLVFMLMSAFTAGGGAIAVIACAHWVDTYTPPHVGRHRATNQRPAYA